jgi:WD40 repeat protein
VTAAFLSPNGARAAIVSGRFVKIWDVVKNQLAYPALTNAQPVSHAEFGRDGTQLVCCGADSTFNRGYAQVYDARSGEPISPQLFHRDGVLFATLSPDGRLVATAGEDFRGMIWETGTGRLIAILNHGEKVNSIAFSPDGERVVTGSADQSARVWDARTGMAITPPLWHIEPVVSAQFVAGGKQVATTDKKGRQYLWELTPDKRPAVEMLKLAGYLSGSMTDVANEPQLAKSRSLDSLEKELETEYPADFSISSKEVEEWHELEAEYGEHNRMWSAAAFHLKWLLNHEAADPSLAGRLAQVNGRLKP